MDTPSPVKGLFLLVLALLLLLPATATIHAQTPNPASPDQPGYDEAEAYAIDRMLMCPVCPAQTIDQTQVPIAQQMRTIVRQMLAEGSTREEILAFFAQRYGQDIVASPPKSGFNLVAWVFPLVGVAASLVAGLFVLRSMSARKVAVVPEAEPVQQVPPDLEPYLEMVDRELALRESRSVSNRDENESELKDADVESQREGSANRNG